IRDHVHLLQRNQTAANHIVLNREDLVDLLLRLDAFDDHRQVHGKVDEARRMNPTPGAETHHAPGDGSAGKLPLAEELNDRPMERLVLELVALSDMVAHKDSFALQAMHISPILRL